MRTETATHDRDLVIAEAPGNIPDVGCAFLNIETAQINTLIDPELSLLLETFLKTGS